MNRSVMRSHQGDSGKHNGQDHRTDDVNQTSMDVPESAFARQSMGKAPLECCQSVCGAASSELLVDRFAICCH